MARKSKALIQKATDDYVEGIMELFPGATIEVSEKAFDGFDVWVRILAPRTILESEDMAERRMSKADLSIRISDETGVNITSTLEDESLVAAGARDAEGNE